MDRGRGRKPGSVGTGILIFLGSVLGSMLFLGVMVFFFGDPMGDFVKSAYGWILNSDGMKLSDGEREYIKSLVENGHLLSPDLYLSEITAFYNNVITVLLGFMGVMGFAGFMYIKAVTRNEAEELAEEAVHREFQTVAFTNTTKDHIVNILNSDMFESYFSDLLERLEAVENKLDPIEVAKISAERAQIHGLLEQMRNIISKESEKLALTDNEEDVGGGLELSEDADQGEDGEQ